MTTFSMSSPQWLGNYNSVRRRQIQKRERLNSPRWRVSSKIHPVCHVSPIRSCPVAAFIRPFLIQDRKRTPKIVEKLWAAIRVQPVIRAIEEACVDLEEALQEYVQLKQLHTSRATFSSTSQLHIEMQAERKLDIAFQVAEKAVEVAPGEVYPEYLQALAIQIDRVSSATLRWAHTNAAIRIGTEAVRLSRDNPKRLVLLRNLGSKLEAEYEKTNDISFLETACQIRRQELDSSKNSSDQRLGMYHLGPSLVKLSRATGNEADGREGMRLVQDAVDMAGDDNHPDRVAGLIYLLGELIKRHELSRTAADLERLLQAARKAVYIRPHDPAFLDILRNALFNRHLAHGSKRDLDRAISAAREVTLVDPSNSYDIELLSKMIYLRYKETDSPNDLQEAIQLAKSKVDMMSRSNIYEEPFTYHLYMQKEMIMGRKGLELEVWKARKGKVSQLAFYSTSTFRNIGRRLRRRYQPIETILDFGDSLRVARQALQITPDNPHLLDKFGFVLDDRYIQTGKRCYLEEAIRMARRSLNVAPDNPYILYTLNYRLCNRYLKTGERKDLDEAIRIARQIVGKAPDDPCLWNCLANCLCIRFQSTTAIADLEDATQIARQTSGSAPEHLDSLNTLAVSLMHLYYRNKASTDLEQAIKVVEQALSLGVNGYPRIKWLGRLGSCLCLRYLGNGAMEDLNRAISESRQAVDSISTNRMFLSLLEARLRKQAIDVGSIEEEEDKIPLAAREAIQFALENPDISDQLVKTGKLFSWPQRTSAMESLRLFEKSGREFLSILERNGERLSDKQSSELSLVELLADNIAYSSSDEPSELEDIFQDILILARQSIDITRDIEVIKANLLLNLGNMLELRYERIGIGAMGDLEEAIVIARNTVDITPSMNDPNRAHHLRTLGARLYSRYRVLGDSEDLNQAEKFLETAFRHTNSFPMDRVYAGADYLDVYIQSGSLYPPRAYEISTLLTNLVPKLTLRPLRNSDKQHELGKVAGIGSNAAAMALLVLGGGSHTATLVLENLEQCRRILGSSLEDMWTDILSLRRQYPGLAEKFLSLRNKIALPIAASLGPLSVHRDTFQPSQQYYNTDEELEKLISSIRRLPGFEGFLGPPGPSAMQSAAAHGPIAVINVSDYRCDALLVEKHGVQALHLPKLSKLELEDRVRQGHLGSPVVLEWLWDVVARPVLNHLGFTGPPLYDDDWPHVWWIPTGPLSKFPLHAAGYHDRDNSYETVMDRVMSSYSSSVKSIIQGRLRGSAASNPSRALLIAMEYTPGHPQVLRSATKEVEHLRSLCVSMGTIPIEPRCRKQDVVSQLPDCNLFHFAGHGYTDKKDPSKSQLLLEDWKEQPLLVSDLLDLNLRERSPFLAYLSACGTGRMDDAELLDESIHLISACQLAGFRHVIGTLWEVHDDLCADMAKITYEVIGNEGMTDTAVCRGLHKASRELRSHWLVKWRESITRRELATRNVSSQRNSKICDSNLPTEFVDSRSNWKDESLFGDGLGWRETPCRIGDEQDTLGPLSKIQWDTRLPRDVELVDEDDYDYMRRHSLDWVPYVHFGV